ncbi:MAG: hypothetical protein Q9163_004433 [Psora crenata]
MTEPDAATPPCPPHESQTNRKLEPKRKRSQEPEASQQIPSNKRPAIDTINNQSSHRVETWLQEESWPKEYFNPNDQTWDNIKADTLARRLEANEMNSLSRPLFAKKKFAASFSSLRRQALEANMITPTETTEDKSLPYRSPGYAEDLGIKGNSYLYDSPEGVTDDSIAIYQSLLNTTQAVPQQSLFGDDQFGETCYKLQTRNEARVVEDASPLIAPSPETLKTFGALELEHLIFNTNERWGESIPITKTCPQPDRCVGFGRSAFTLTQLQNLTPYTGNLIPVDYNSPFLATWRMYFPFFACECGHGDLHVADKQNAHSMTMAVRGIVELFKAVKREKELDRKILAFSISHDATDVRIYGHYASIKDHAAAKFYHHRIRFFTFAEPNGEYKWTAYQFTKNVYFHFMPKLHKLICSAIDQLSFVVAPQPPISHSQDLLGSPFGTDPESEQPDSQEMASGPTSEGTRGSKKPRLSVNAMLKQQVVELEQQVSGRERHTSEALRTLQEELERQRRESKEQLEQQRQQISKLTDTIAALARNSQNIMGK